jgi:lipoic acid synthetase
MEKPGKKPAWLKIKINTNENFAHLNKMIEDKNLNTVCVEAACPNIYECWSAGTATFMILGDTCTRSCGFCNVKTGNSDWVDPDEPRRVAESIVKMKVKYAVITSVNRDELLHGGAEMFAETVKEVRRLSPECELELLVPDFKGCLDSLKIVAASQPKVLAHNIETIKRLTPSVRPQADYERSLEVIENISRLGLVSKSGLMGGLGEDFDEIVETMKDLVAVGCQIFNVGQYLQPTRKHLAVERWVHPDEFEKLAKIGRELGLGHVEAGPLVRSSYHAEKQMESFNAHE